MSLSTYMYAFGLQPDRRAEFVEWARTTGVPFWLTRPGLRTYRTYRVFAGSRASVALAELDSGEVLGRFWIRPSGPRS